MRHDFLTIKNTQTGQIETIRQCEITQKDWGFSFFVDSELEAYKAAYAYRNSPHGVEVVFAGGAQKWMVTVFNQLAKQIGLSAAR